MYYALHSTKIPAFIAIIATIINFATNWFILDILQATGLALATTISCIIRTILYVILLHKFFNFKIYLKRFSSFLGCYLAQIFLFTGPFLLAYRYATQAIEQFFPSLANFLLYNIGFWLWVGPLCAVFALGLFYSRHIFKIRLYFVD